MITVTLSVYNVFDSLVPGHFCAYLQYALGFRQLGCRVHWLEESKVALPLTDRHRELLRIIDGCDLGGKAVLYRRRHRGGRLLMEQIGSEEEVTDALPGQTDVLINFHYALAAQVLNRFRRTALVDIDPGLLQYWISSGQLNVAHHDRYFSTGETVGTRDAAFSDCGLDWIRIRPAVSLEMWPVVSLPVSDAFTTVSSWWGGGGKGEWVGSKQHGFDNNKRTAFLPFVDLPRLTGQRLELALCIGENDRAELLMLEEKGWRIRDSSAVTGTPADYQRYVQRSRGEFTCVKPAYRRWRTAWLGDRTLCYLASGKPAIVEDAGPSRILPPGEGLLRFTTLSQAAEALRSVTDDYAKHSRAARALAEEHFDAKKIAAAILEQAL